MGLTQTILILTYVIVRVYNWRQAILPITYFSTFAVVFLAQFALRIEDIREITRLILWGGWALIPPLGYLLILQIAYNTAPKLKEYWVLLLPIIFFIFIINLNRGDGICNIDIKYYCARLFDWLNLGSGLVATITLLFLFTHQDLFSSIRKKSKSGYERYWLVISLIIMNMAGAGVNIIRSTDKKIPENISDATLLVMGLGFIYLTTTMFFRIYPPAISLKTTPKKQRAENIDNLTDREYEIALKIKDLMELDKLYQEPSFSRADLARELNISENSVSYIINVAFGKTFPQILNERRVKDAKNMLKDNSIPIKTVAFDAGFNSLASFNRVFRNITGKSPSDYRNEESKNLEKSN